MAYEEIPQHYKQFISTLPCCNAWPTPLPLRNYNGFWYPEWYLEGGLYFQDHFKPRDTDIFVISPPKSGTTWLKALTFATVKRKDYNPTANDHPLLDKNPHDCIFLVDKIFGRGKNSELDNLDPPRLLNSHTAIENLPESLIRSDSKIIYICRDPKDTLVSTWHFFNRTAPSGKDPISFNEAYELFCNGVSPFGPVWEHQLGYWKESLNRPEKVLFLKYEGMMEDTIEDLKKLAEFVGYPFSEEEEKEGVVEAIVKLCSFEKLSRLDVNRMTDHKTANKISVKNSSYFRKGKVGDWKNHLTPEMARRLDVITEKKLEGSGLSFCSPGLELEGVEPEHMEAEAVDLVEI